MIACSIVIKMFNICLLLAEESDTDCSDGKNKRLSQKLPGGYLAGDDVVSINCCVCSNLCFTAYPM